MTAGEIRSKLLGLLGDLYMIDPETATDETPLGNHGLGYSYQQGRLLSVEFSGLFRITVTGTSIGSCQTFGALCGQVIDLVQASEPATS